MKSSTRLAVAALALLAGFALSGCPALMIPSLAYEGYKYEKGKKQEQASTQDPQRDKTSNESRSDQYYDTE